MVLFCYGQICSCSDAISYLRPDSYHIWISPESVLDQNKFYTRESFPRDQKKPLKHSISRILPKGANANNFSADYRWVMSGGKPNWTASAEALPLTKVLRWDTPLFLFPRGFKEKFQT